MPNNLIYNPETQMWDVPNERRFPSNTGIWGASEVASLLPELGEGFNRDYLTHLGYGATQEHNSGGLSNAYWGAPNLYGAPPSGQVGNWMGQPTGGYPAPPYGTGNNWADMSTPQPIDYTSYYGALGNTGGNNTNQGLAAGLSPQYADYFATMGLPNGGFGGANDVPTGGTSVVGSIDNPFPTPPGGYGSLQPSAADAFSAQYQAQIAAQQAAFTANQVAQNNYNSQNVFGGYNPVTGWGNGMVNSLTGAINW